MTEPDPVAALAAELAELSGQVGALLGQLARSQGDIGVLREHFGMDERRDNIQMIVIGDVTVLAQSLESGLIDVTVVPPFLSRRLAEKGFTVLGRCEQTKLPSVGMTVLVERPYLQQNAETLQGVMMALIEGMAFTGHPRNKSVVLETLAKQFRMTDTVAVEGAYQDVATLVRLEEGRKPYVSLEGMRILQRLLKPQNPKIGEIKVDLDVNVELAAPDQFLPPLPDWREFAPLSKSTSITKISRAPSPWSRGTTRWCGTRRRDFLMFRRMLPCEKTIFSA